MRIRERDLVADECFASERPMASHGFGNQTILRGQGDFGATFRRFVAVFLLISSIGIPSCIASYSGGGPLSGHETPVSSGDPLPPQTFVVGDPCWNPGFECGPESSCLIVATLEGYCGPSGSASLKAECKSPFDEGASESEICMWGSNCGPRCVEQPLFGSDDSYPWHCREYGADVPAVNSPMFCQSRCDPFVPFDCDGSCLLANDGLGEGFHCSFRPVKSFAEGCEFVNELCDTGLVCAPTEELGEFCASGSLGCCTALCDLSLPDPNADCLGFDVIDTCVPVFDDPVDDWEARIGKCVVLP